MQSISANQTGTLFIVATPIGNLGDFSQRAIDCLRSVALIAAEDTRHSRKLLDAWGINTVMTAVHEHNEQAASQNLLEKLNSGLDIALISDAGTPLISDPGQRLVAAAIDAGITVSPIPGACAATAALSAAGLAAQPHWFEGFLPAKSGERNKRLSELTGISASLVFYEAPHRIAASLAAMADTLGSQRQACVAREISKRYEQFHRGNLAQLAAQFANGEHCRGEMVVIIEGASTAQPKHLIDSRQLLEQLLPHMPIKAAAKLASDLSGEPKNSLYQLALSLKQA